MDAETAQKSFEISNDVQTVDPSVDAVFRYDEAEQKRVSAEKPWKNDPNHFKKVRISAVALIKMVMHARSGGVYEIMGLMQGKVHGDTVYIMDAFALPVQGTETRVNAVGEAYEYMVEYLESSKAVGRLENAVGWYHSHPGYGCWLSGIDVNTQMLNQTYQDPWVAVVIDPNRTISAGKVDIGAFRTYPEDYKPPGAAQSEYQSIPLSKIEDFGVHADRYYNLEVSIFKSTLDTKLLGLLWNKYWVNTLSQSPLVSNRAYAVGQITDLSAKLRQATPSLQARSASITSPSLSPAAIGGGPNGPDASGAASGRPSSTEQGKGKGKGKGKETELPGAAERRKVEEETPIAKAVRDSTKISVEAQHGLITQVLKDILFNRSEAIGAPMPSVLP